MLGWMGQQVVVGQQCRRSFERSEYVVKGQHNVVTFAYEPQVIAVELIGMHTRHGANIIEAQRDQPEILHALQPYRHRAQPQPLPPLLPPRVQPPPWLPPLQV